jgi:hypothetical protein
VTLTATVTSIPKIAPPTKTVRKNPASFMFAPQRYAFSFKLTAVLGVGCLLCLIGNQQSRIPSQVHLAKTEVYGEFVRPPPPCQACVFF